MISCLNRLFFYQKQLWITSHLKIKISNISENRHKASGLIFISWFIISVSHLTVHSGNLYLKQFHNTVNGFYFSHSTQPYITL